MLSSCLIRFLMTSLVAAFLWVLDILGIAGVVLRFFIFYISVSILVSCSVLSTSVYPHMTYCEGDMCLNAYCLLLFNTVFCFVLIGKDRFEVSGFEVVCYLLFSLLVLVYSFPLPNKLLGFGFFFFCGFVYGIFSCVFYVIPSKVWFL